MQNNQELREAVKKVQEGRRSRNAEIVAKLGEWDLDVTYEEWLAEAGGEEETLGRPNMAQVRTGRAVPHAHTLRAPRRRQRVT